MRRLVAVTAAVLLLAGCGTGGFRGLYDAPLPGGADLGARPYRVTVQFGDVLDLVPQASVKHNDVAIGRVDGIALAPDNSVATVDVVVNGDVQLPANARAELRQSSLLGEKYVEIADPLGEPPRDVLRDGAVIPVASTSRNPEVEEVLGALSMLLNGGGVAHLQDIVGEVNQALDGNEPQIRSLLGRLDQLIEQLDGQKATIVRAIDGLAHLSDALAGQTGNLATAIDELGPGIDAIEEQRTQLVGMLEALDRLSDVAVDTIHRSRDDLVADLRALAPTLQKLAEAGSDLPRSLQFVLTYPFPDYAMESLKGDFFNTDVRIDLDLSTTLGNLSRSSQPPVALPDALGGGLPGLLPPAPSGKREPGEGGGVPGVLGDLLGGSS
ncbi:MCE family protein [Pseudonocardia sp. CA-107938]|uniref:MCE family protein n=1 Tax=Pseudonocardia sp. CA-107938 TaxID=3240021 RepID=UPI003D8FCDC4